MSVISFSGLASGIDGDAVIKAIIDSRKLVAAPIENKVTANEDENKALQEFNTKMLALGDAAREFMTLNGGSVSKNAVSSIDDILSASANNNALTGSTTVTVKALARAATVSFSDTFGALDQPIFPSLAAPSEIQITVGSGDAQKTYSIEIDSETTLGGLTQKISEATDGKVRASAINLSGGTPARYTLVIQGTDTGVSKGSLALTVPPEAGLFQTPTVDQAADALINVAGVGDISRPSNNITDVIPGVNLSLKQAMDTPVLVTVGSDAKKTAEKFGKVIQAYNEIVKYSKEQSKIERVEDDDKSTNVFSPLARIRVDERALDDIRAALADSRSAVGDSPVRVLSDLGITTQRDGTLAFDDKKFIEAVNQNPAAAEGLMSSFADKLGSVDGVIAQYTRYQGQIDIAKKANDDENETMKERLDRITVSLDKQTEMLKRTFATLESNVGKLNSDQQALTAILAGMKSS